MPALQASTMMTYLNKNSEKFINAGKTSITCIEIMNSTTDTGFMFFQNEKTFITTMNFYKGFS